MSLVKQAQALQMARQIANLYLHLHKSKLIHRDLKSLNIHILLDEYFRVKLCDFGLAPLFWFLQGGSSLWEIGTSWYNAEITEGKTVGSNVDIQKPIQKIIKESRSLNPDMRPSFDRVCELFGKKLILRREKLRKKNRFIRMGLALWSQLIFSYLNFFND